PSAVAWGGCRTRAGGAPPSARPGTRSLRRLPRSPAQRAAARTSGYGSSLRRKRRPGEPIRGEGCSEGCRWRCGASGSYLRPLGREAQLDQVEDLRDDLQRRAGFLSGVPDDCFLQLRTQAERLPERGFPPEEEGADVHDRVGRTAFHSASSRPFLLGAEHVRSLVVVEQRLDGNDFVQSGCSVRLHLLPPLQRFAYPVLLRVPPAVERPNQELQVVNRLPRKLPDLLTPRDVAGNDGPDGILEPLRDARDGGCARHLGAPPDSGGGTQELIGVGDARSGQQPLELVEVLRRLGGEVRVQAIGHQALTRALRTASFISRTARSR